MTTPVILDDTSLTKTLREVFQIKVGSLDTSGWSPRLRHRFGYFTPDEWYEAILFTLIGECTDWLDVGCGRRLFPFNPKVADILASRCRLLVGVDPDDNINENLWLHERRQCLLTKYETDKQFDIVSLRMVAEHIIEPETTAAALGRLTREGGRVIVYTVSKRSLSAAVSAVTPTIIHERIRLALWQSSPRDTFPTVYQMNTQAELLRLFSTIGFFEEKFLNINDCRIFERWKITSALELWVENEFKKRNLRYPESCIIGIYRKQHL
jgi:2-polyprenyl-3-methyl-5-hydroxy-6-metoxy-1,4-benzoquinol methylase